MLFKVIVLVPTSDSSEYPKMYRPSFEIFSTGEGMILMKDCLLDAGIWLKREK